MGSSPLARGLPPHTVEGGVVDGIIPARAGFTSTPTTTWPRSWDHPRSRGVYARWMGYDTERLGSSPLARGLRPRVGRGRMGRRIIPARAGFTPIPH